MGPPPTGRRLTAGAAGLCCGYQAAAGLCHGPPGLHGKEGRVRLLWLVHGGHQVGLLAVHGPQLVGLGDEEPNILVVVFTQHDAELSR